MADTQGKGASIFRQSAMSRIASADDLDKYIKVTNPSAWVVLIASILLIGGLTIWAATAVIPTTVHVTGIVMETDVLCWVDQETQEKIVDGGAYATVMDIETTELAIDDIPYSRKEVEQEFASDYLLDSVTLYDWNYEITMKLKQEIEGADEDNARPAPVSITVSETNPLSLVLGNAN